MSTFTLSEHEMQLAYTAVGQPVDVSLVLFRLRRAADEGHRFSVEERAALLDWASKFRVAHAMTAKHLTTIEELVAAPAGSRS